MNRLLFFYSFVHTNTGDKMRILIIGGAGGIAYNTAKKFAMNNHLVYLCVHTNEQLETIKKRLKDESLLMHVFKLDILNKQDLTLLDKIEYDVLWIHAGIGIGGSLLAMSVDNLKKNYKVNVFGIIRMLKKAYYRMEKNKIKGHIFVTSSVSRTLPFPFLGCYTSSRASLSMLVHTLNQEMKFLKSNITLSLIELGAYHTGFNQVMIDNKEQYLDKNSLFYKRRHSINRLQRNIFRLIESDNIDKLSDYLVKNMTKKNPKFLLRYPKGQALFVKMFEFFKM